MVRNKGNNSRSRKRKSEQRRKPPQKKQKYDITNKPDYMKEREARAKENTFPKRYEPPLIQKAENWTNVQNKHSESEEEDPLKVLLGTFNNKKLTKVAIVSDSESDEDVDEGSEKERNLEEENDLEDEEEEIEEDEDENDLGDEEEVEVEEEVDEEVEEEEDEEEEEEKDQEGESDDQEIVVNQEEDEDYDPKTENSDPFSLHLQNDISDELYNSISTTSNYKTHDLNWSKLGKILCQIPTTETSKTEPSDQKQKTLVSLDEKNEFAKPGRPPNPISTIDWKSLFVKSQIHVNVSKVNYDNIKNNLETTKTPLTPLQTELFSLINNYQDLLYTERSFTNAEEIRLVYCLHTMNHILKTRMRILRHNLKLSKNRTNEVPDEFLDQGLVRPKILILVPFRDSCLKIVKMLIGLLIDEGKGGSVMNKKRFFEEFAGGEILMPKKNPKPEDYELTFSGNSDDSFRIGIQVTKKVLKLYSNFYSSDIIVASPLGLRTLIGAEGEADRDYDFLASIELLILDQTEIFLMQNWDHFIHLMDHMHLQPKTSRGTDFSRIRSWAVNGWTKYYRQTLIFSSYDVPEIQGIFSKRCHNFAGRNKISNSIFPGSASQVVIQVPQVYHRFEATSYSQAIDARFKFFVTKILPQYTDSMMGHTLIFVPSYFDFVSLRNYMKDEQISFVQICEYSKDSKIAKARDIFFHSESQFLLYSERFHFFRRIRVKGIRHILFYGPPVSPHFYSEMINLMQESNQNPKGGSESNMSVTVVYCKYDILQLSSIIGTERASKMLTSEKNVHMIITDK
ncbi:U3 small nucleolar RNA-associated protein 25 homolog [Leptopilina heterotoma]|uniref:U3 small nucleolar RNA-associated protein 25 homolog n=1 Tax=Leptopilina heterotoma TaxID=63436 RepID=UPI001CA88B18|nr:U3 small nucleolar RNA-associated protein 25 homolog [Leptopilina heterotoma]